jgi:hypothetical protein
MHVGKTDAHGLGTAQHTSFVPNSQLYIPLILHIFIMHSTQALSSYQVQRLDDGSIQEEFKEWSAFTNRHVHHTYK